MFLQMVLSCDFVYDIQSTMYKYFNRNIHKSVVPTTGNKQGWPMHCVNSPIAQGKSLGAPKCATPQMKLFLFIAHNTSQK